MESWLEATERKHHIDDYLICCPKQNYEVIRLIDDNSWGQHVHHEAGPSQTRCNHVLCIFDGSGHLVPIRSAYLLVYRAMSEKLLQYLLQNLSQLTATENILHDPFYT